jgi:hypothetical protein
LDEDIVSSEEFSQGGHVEEAEVLADAMTEHAANKLLALSDLREQRTMKQTIFKVAKKETKQQAQVASSCKAEHDASQAKSTELSAVIEIVKQLVVCVEPASPGRSVQGACAASLLEDGPEGAEEIQPEAAEDTPEATDDALALGNDLIIAAGEAVDAETPGDKSSQDSSASVHPSNLQAAFDLANEKAGENAEEDINEKSGHEQDPQYDDACAEPLEKKRRLDDEKEDLAESAKDHVMVTDQVQSIEIARKELQSPVDLQGVITSGGA